MQVYRNPDVYIYVKGFTVNIGIGVPIFAWNWASGMPIFGSAYFHLIPVRKLQCEEARGVWGHAPPGKSLKLDTLRSLLRSFLGQNTTRITPPVVSVARETVETIAARKNLHAHDAHVSPSQICALASRSSIARKLRSLHSLAATLDAWRLEKVRRWPLRCPKLRQTARRGHSTGTEKAIWSTLRMRGKNRHKKNQLS